jgi:hypothetical protein
LLSGFGPRVFFDGGGSGSGAMSAEAMGGAVGSADVSGLVGGSSAPGDGA